MKKRNAYTIIAFAISIVITLFIIFYFSQSKIPAPFAENREGITNDRILKVLGIFDSYYNDFAEKGQFRCICSVLDKLESLYSLDQKQKPLLQRIFPVEQAIRKDLQPLGYEVHLSPTLKMGHKFLRCWIGVFNNSTHEVTTDSGEVIEITRSVFTKPLLKGVFNHHYFKRNPDVIKMRTNAYASRQDRRVVIDQDCCNDLAEGYLKIVYDLIEEGHDVESMETIIEGIGPSKVIKKAREKFSIYVADCIYKVGREVYRSDAAGETRAQKLKYLSEQIFHDVFVHELIHIEDTKNHDQQHGEAWTDLNVIFRSEIPLHRTRWLINKVWNRTHDYKKASWILYNFIRLKKELDIVPMEEFEPDAFKFDELSIVCELENSELRDFAGALIESWVYK